MVGAWRDRAGWATLWTALGCALGSWIAGAAASRGESQQLLFAIIGASLLALILARPRVGLMLIIAGVFSFEYLVGIGVLPVAGMWLVDGLVFALFGRVVLLADRGRGRFLRGQATGPALLWALLVIGSGMANLTPPLQIALGLRPFLRMVALYFCLLEFDWGDAFLRRCLYAITALFLLQLPVMAIQRLRGVNVDGISGTIAAGGGTGLIGVAAMGFFAGLVAYGAYTRKRIPVVLGFAVLLGPALATARVFLFLVPVVAAFVVWRLGIRRLSGWVFVAIIVIGLLLAAWDAVQGGQSARGQSSLDLLRDPSPLVAEWFDEPVQGTHGASVGRGYALSATWLFITRDWNSTMLGLGPQTARGSRFAALRSSIFDTLAEELGRNVAELPRVLLEWGVLGTLAYTAVHAALWRRATTFLRSAEDPFWRAAAFGYTTYVVFAVALTPYTGTWTGTLTAFLVWFVGGALERVTMREEIP